MKKAYAGPPETLALDGVSFSLDEGSLAAVVGPSGSGKTTLLNLASGLDRPSAGEIRIHGKSIEGLSPRQLADFRLRNLGFVFQAYNLFPSLTAIENVEYTMLLRGESPAQARAAAARSLARVGLAEKEGAFPNRLSGGQQQRVAVARALASSPKLILADEPTANLDSKTAQQLIDLFLELNAERKTTFLFSTHDMRIVNRVRTVLNLVDGRLDGAPA